MNILHIVDHLGFGGMQSLVKGIFEGQPNNHHLFLYVLRESVKVVAIHHENVITYPAHSKYSFRPLNKLKQIIRDHHIGVLHCHLFRAQLFGFLIKKWHFPEIHLIFHEHGAIVGCDRNNFLRDRLYVQLMRSAAPDLDVVIAVSRAVKQKLIERARIPANKIAVLYNFVDLNTFHPQNLGGGHREKFGIARDDFVVGFAGRIIERKGWQEYVQAAQILSSIIPDIKFLISGDGDQKRHLIHAITREHLQNRVTFLGYIPDMIKFYACLDCFVIPSRWEPLGITEIEAQACGIPVIASNIPGLNEIIQHDYNGLLFEMKNSHDLSEKIQMLYTNQQLRSVIVVNGLRSAQQYGLDHFLSELNTIYTTTNIHRSI